MPGINHEIKELVFNGGGARGVGMPGVYYALRNLNAWEKEEAIWEGIETLAGASVGALTAAMFSVGPDFDDLNEEIVSKNLLEILGIEKDILPFHFSMDPLKIFINVYLAKQVKKYLEKEAESLRQVNDDLSHSLLHLLDELKHDDYQVTFSDLNLLHQQKPSKFKNLIVTSTASKQGKKVVYVYNATKTPEQSIAEACAASAALPIIFKPVTVDGTRHVDGGCEDPLPSEYFEDDTPERRTKRLLFLFGPGPSLLGKIWERALHGHPSPKFNFCTNMTELSLYTGDKRNTSVQYTEEKMVSIWVNNDTRIVHYCVTSTPDIHGTLAFDKLGLEKGEQIEDENGFAPHLIDFYTHLARRKHLPSVLGDYSPLWAVNYCAPVIKSVIGFPLYIGTLFESLGQRIKTFYTFNTVLLNTTLVANSFKQSEIIKSTSIALYYLATMNHLTLYDFADTKHQQFYTSIMSNYLAIYKTFLNARSIQSDEFLKQYESEKNIRVLFEMVKEDVEKNPTSTRAFALTCAVELHLKQKNTDEIMLQVNKKARKECESFGGFFHKNRYAQQSSFPTDCDSTSHPSATMSEKP